MNLNIDQIIEKQMDQTISETNLNIGEKYQGKVRDVYDLDDKLLIVTTDRISAFDRVLTTIPFKGEILTQLSNFWFDQTSDIIHNHVIKKVHPNAILVKKCSILPIEVIIRGYLTGGGWREYSKTGKISGISLPEGLKKNTKFETPIFTPTTKAKEGHDMPISKEEIIEQNIIDQDLLEKIIDTAQKLFKRGTEIAQKNNLILVDTKYEFGLLEDGTLILADEIHTSDSSRYWYLDSYQKLYEAGEEQKMLDKEFLRQWLMDNNYQGDGQPPVIPDDIKAGVCKKYLTAYETITGQTYALSNKNSLAGLINAVKEIG